MAMMTVWRRRINKKRNNDAKEDNDKNGMKNNNS